MSIKVGTGGSGGDAGFRLGQSQNVFDVLTGTLNDAIALREQYASENPSWLQSYQTDFDENKPSSVLLMYVDGTTPTATYTQYNGSELGWKTLSTVKGLRGVPGEAGDIGPQIEAAVFVDEDIEFTLSDGSIVTLFDAKQTLKGEKGEDGAKVESAVFVDEDIKFTLSDGSVVILQDAIYILKGDDGIGVVAGGTTGQVLAKKSNDDYDTEWVDQTGGGGSNVFEELILKSDDGTGSSISYDSNSFGRFPLLKVREGVLGVVDFGNLSSSIDLYSFSKDNFGLFYLSDMVPVTLQPDDTQSGITGSHEFFFDVGAGESVVCAGVLIKIAQNSEVFVGLSDEHGNVLRETQQVLRRQKDIPEALISFLNDSDNLVVLTSGRYSVYIDIISGSLIGSETEPFALTFKTTVEHSKIATKGDIDLLQPTLVSGENIKTINGNSILGKGNIDIGGGGGSLEPWQSDVLTQMKPILDDGYLYFAKEDLESPETVVGRTPFRIDGRNRIYESFDTETSQWNYIGNILTNDEMEEFQPKLVSGVNISTINGRNLIDERDIILEGWDRRINLNGAENISIKTDDGVASLYHVDNIEKIGEWVDDGNFVPVGDSYTINQSMIDVFAFYVRLTDNELFSFNTNAESSWALKFTKSGESDRFYGIDFYDKDNTMMSKVVLKGGLSLTGWAFQLMCKPTFKEGLKPSMSFNIKFFLDNEVEWMLFDDDKKINTSFIGPVTPSNNIKLYSIENPENRRSPFNPKVSYNSYVFGEIPVISVDEERTRSIIEMGSYASLVRFKSHSIPQVLVTKNEELLTISDEMDEMLSSGVYVKEFTNTTKLNEMVAVAFGVVGTAIINKTEINVVVRHKETANIIVSKRSVFNTTDRPHQVYVVLDEPVQLWSHDGSFELIVEIESGYMVGGDGFPAAWMHFTESQETTLATNLSISQQLNVHTNVDSFVTDNSGIIVSIKQTVDDVPADAYTIPRKNSTGIIRGISSNVFTPDTIIPSLAVGDTIKIEADIDDIHPTNFRDGDGQQCYVLVANPNTQTFTALKNLGYEVFADGTVPVPSEPSKMLINDADNIMKWVDIGAVDGAINLSPTLRIRGIEGVGIVHEMLVDGNWVELGKFER